MSENQKVDKRIKVGVLYAAVGGTNSGPGSNDTKIKPAEVLSWPRSIES
jgi:hypothetical protein